MAVSGGRDVDPSSVGAMEGAFFVGRTELLDWVNKAFNLRLTKVEQCASGAVYIQILDALYPKQVPMSKVKWDARLDYEYIHNYKIIQSVFSRLDIKKHIEVDKLTRGKYQDNLEFLQWMKAFFDRQSAVLADSGATANSGSYNGLERRKLAQCTLPDWAKGETAATGLPAGATGAATTTSSSTPPPATGRDGSPSKGASVVPSARRVGPSSGNAHANATGQPNRLNSCNATNRPRTASVGGKRVGVGPQGKTGIPTNSTGSPGSTDVAGKASAATPAVAEGVDKKDHLIAKLKSQAEQQQAESMARMAEYEEQLQQAVLEKEFYFNKLRQLELMCQEGSAQTFTVEEVQKVLYATDDVEEDETVPPVGETTASPEDMAMQENTISPSSAALPLSQQTTSEAATEAPSALSLPSEEKLEGFETPVGAQGLVPMAQ